MQKRLLLKTKITKTEHEINKAGARFVKELHFCLHTTANLVFVKLYLNN